MTDRPGNDKAGLIGMHDVCVITTIHGDFDNRIYYRQACSLIDAGMSVCIIAPWNFSKRSRTDFAYVQTEPATNRFSRIRHACRTYRAARGVIASTYIFHDPDFLFFGWLLACVCGRPVVYDCHENIPEDILYGKAWIPTVLRRPVSLLFRRFENGVVKRLGRALVVVPFLARRFEKLGANVLLVRNFPRFKVNEGLKLDRAVLYTGGLTRDYGLDNLLGIAREMKRRNLDVPLRIVDRFRNAEELRPIVQRIVHEEQLNIEFLNPVYAEDMPKILAKGCIGLSPIPDLPNKRIAYPTKLFEYFAFGLVVIASDIAGTREILENGKLGILLPPCDYCSWANHIERLLDDQQYFDQFALAAKTAVVEKYNWDREEKDMIQYVRSIIG